MGEGKGGGGASRTSDSSVRPSHGSRHDLRRRRWACRGGPSDDKRGAGPMTGARYSRPNGGAAFYPGKTGKKKLNENECASKNDDSRIFTQFDGRRDSLPFPVLGVRRRLGWRCVVLDESLQVVLVVVRRFGAFPEGQSSALHYWYVAAGNMFFFSPFRRGERDEEGVLPPSLTFET